ncbi:hypothetical protein PGB90_010466 [Kerria lacca]
MLVFILLLFALIAFFMRIVKSVRFWERNGKCNPKFSLIWTNTKNSLFCRNNIANRMDLIYRAYPNNKFIGHYEVLKPTLLIKDPELIGEMFVKNFQSFHDRFSEQDRKDRISQHVFTLAGSKWKQVRSKLVTTFSPVKLKMMYPILQRCSEILMSYVSEQPKTNQVIDAKDMTARYALDVIGCCAFGLEFNALNDPNSEFRKISKESSGSTTGNSIRRIIRLLDSTRLLKKLFNFHEISPKVDTFFFNLLKDTKELRENELITRNDFVQLMLDMRTKELANGEKNVIFTDEIIASNMFVFFFAGFETISTTLSFCLYEMALNPEIQEKVRNEVERVRESHNGVIDFDSLARLTYMEMVLEETLRKYPPAVSVFRVCTQPYEIPGSDMVLHPYDSVSIPIYSIHHDERYYENPKKFDPERFTEENKARRVPNTYMPFGIGPRICLGLRFAYIEMKCCLAELLHRYKFIPCDKTDIPVKITTTATTYTTDKPIWLTVKEV